jgi:tetraacyldisaccharide 4'-kinase
VRGEAYFRALVGGERRRWEDLLLLALLRCLAVPYATLLRLRALAYRAGVLRTRRLPRPVISVGNLTVGGTGKTPMVVWLARCLQGQGRRVAVLSRGYGGSREGTVALVSDGDRLLLGPAEAGDEPYLLATLLPGVAVVIGSDRYQAGLAALAAAEPDLFILDDGFQHLRLHRDLNLLLLDCQAPLANGWTLPAGLLREPATAMVRADLIVFTRCGAGALPILPAVAATPHCGSRHLLTGFRELAGGGAVQPFVALGKRRGVAIAGIANPASFFADLSLAGLALAATLAFPDHCAFGADELAAITDLCRKVRAEYLIMTAKDAVKLADRLAGPWQCLVAELELVPDDAELLRQHVEKQL